MVKKWMTWVNGAAAAMIVLLLLAAIYLWLIKPRSFPEMDAAFPKPKLPKGAFERPKKSYDAINEPVLKLKFAPLSLQLPDLRRGLLYYGTNERPDAKTEKPLLYFAFAPKESPSTLLPGQQYYLIYDKSEKRYAFSPDNAKTPLWIEVNVPEGNQVAINVAMEGEDGTVIREPASNAQFALAAKEYVRSGGSTWSLGNLRVDGTFLARQKAKWYGVDRFLEKHGGEEYTGYEDKQRLDFGEKDHIYSVYLGPKDCMIWKDERWHVVKPGKDSLDYPLMCVKKIDDRIMSLQLWDVEGKGKITLNLLKTTESWLPNNLLQGFKFMGARTRSQFVFEINNERMILRPKDWLVLTNQGWKKLVTPEEIDQFVERQVTGPLFVFDGIGKKEDKQVILGTMFNAARTEKVEIELPLQSGGGAKAGNQGGNPAPKDLKRPGSPQVPPVDRRGRMNRQTKEGG